MTSAVLMAVGAIVLVAGWWEVSDRASMESQIPAFNIAVLGLVLIGAGQGLWFLRGRRACSDRRRLLLGADAAPAVISAAVEDTDSFAGTERFYHRLDCAMVDDRDWAPSPRATHERVGRTPCGVCAP
ncbi:hypothetical protein [Sporichthya polymorpha]|uniref:hypothetical protein n=1 Tax=Sporichthya polymorpha TaxID=35751 RepID=UPI0003821855|nr:hypothetical protein [Sporichthya polymorpha]